MHAALETPLRDMGPDYYAVSDRRINDLFRTQLERLTISLSPAGGPHSIRSTGRRLCGSPLEADGTLDWAVRGGKTEIVALALTLSLGVTPTVSVIADPQAPEERPFRFTHHSPGRRSPARSYPKQKFRS